ncbi:sensor histidine kinase [Clostridium akagii]|uniref:sensor histidine kinase n=1 Tax=Clostridium akagii TaxID=91623 RepID=UPI000B31D46D|nr:HAMP domain-containing sensor histidine kinase [Clostridium akagii]
MKKTIVGTIVITMLLMWITISNIENSHFVKKMPSISITNGWQYRDGDSPKDKDGNSTWVNDKTSWKSLKSPLNPHINDSKGYAWLKVVLTKENFRDPSIYFYTYNQDFQMFINDKLIYSFGSFNSDNLHKLPGSFWHIIELPNDYAGKTVYIRMHSLDTSAVGNVRNFEISSASNHLINVIKENLPSFIFACLFVFVGFSVLIVSIIKLKGSKIFMSFSFACITSGIWLIAGGEIKQMFFYAPQYWEYIKIISQYLIPVAFSLFINNLLENKFEIIYKNVMGFHLVLLVLSLLLNFFNIIRIDSTVHIFYVSFSISMIIIIISIIKAYDSWNTEIKTFLFGFIALCCFGIFDVLNWNFNSNHSELYLSQWGISIFLMSLFIVIILHYIRAKDEVIEYSEKLKSKEKILVESQQELEFFANISHELRTPLNILLSTLQLLNLYIRDGSIKIAGRDISKHFNVMKQNCYRLLKLVNNLIDVNKIDSGYLKADFKNMDIVSVVEDITQSAANYIKSRGISITFDTDIEEKIIACDFEKIERIILNLLSNAVKFSNAGGSIFVGVHDGDANVEIVVEDTGIGIEKDKIDSVFERFVQVDKSFTRDHEGSGIGLSLVKSLVDMHGGNICVESKYGEGSKFKINLPVKHIVNGEICEINEGSAVHVEKISIEFSDI